MFLITDLAMEMPSLASIPTEIFELVCSHLSFQDIANLERTGKALKRKIENGRVWRKQAERINRKFDYKLIKQMIEYTRCNQVSQKYLKIIIGEFVDISPSPPTHVLPLYCTVLYCTRSILGLVWLPFVCLFVFYFVFSPFLPLDTQLQ